MWKSSFRICYYNNLIYLDPIISLGAIGYISDLTLSGTGLRWNFPKDKYIEYEPEDERWARKLDFGFETKQQYNIVYNRVMLIHSNEYWSIFLLPIRADSIFNYNNQIRFQYLPLTLNKYKNQLNNIYKKYPYNKVIVDENLPKLLKME